MSGGVRIVGEAVGYTVERAPVLLVDFDLHRVAMCWTRRM
jgi:hypothetical protein